MSVGCAVSNFCSARRKLPQANIEKPKLGFIQRFPRSRLLTFNENWLPRELPNVDKELTGSLQPFFQQVQQDNVIESKTLPVI